MLVWVELEYCNEFTFSSVVHYTHHNTDFILCVIVVYIFVVCYFSYHESLLFSPKTLGDYWPLTRNSFKKKFSGH